MIVRRLRIVALLLGVFLSGVTVGWAVVRAMDARRVRWVAEAPPDRIDARFTLFFLERPLHLRRDQREAIEQIFADDHREVSALRRRMEPELGVLRRQRRARIRTLLDAPQRAAYDTILDQFDRYAPRPAAPP